MRKATMKSAVATATNQSQRKVPPPTVANGSDIARRAYDLYLARGREDGHDVEDWLQAERELRADAEC
jgi:hypothetical protein